MSAKPKCEYWASCYRKNPQHLAEFQHPKNHDPEKNTPEEEADEKPPAKKQKIESPPPKKPKKPDLPACPYGAGCYRKNVLHFGEFSHPVKTVGQKEMENSDEEKSSGGSSGGNDWVAGGTGDDDDDKDSGPKLKRSYSQMSEDERMKLIEEAIKLKSELKKKQKEIDTKEAQIKKMKEKLKTGIIPRLEGEEEALKKTKVTVFKLTISRLSNFGDIGEFHYRYAESQFLRLMGGQQQLYVTQVDYIINPKLVKQYEKKQELLRKEGKDTSHILGWHGTSDDIIDKILENNFIIPPSTYMGTYGAGIYFSEYTSTSMGYNSASRILLSKVLIGRQYKCPGVMSGAPLKKGYDSHISPCGTETVIYDNHQILPSYVVHFTQGQAQVDIHSDGAGSSITVSNKSKAAPPPKPKKVKTLFAKKGAVKKKKKKGK